MMKDLKSGIEHIKQAKAHMLQATWIMSDCISKLKELEVENAGLRAKLEAFIQSDDSYMKLPLDANGEPIHIGDVLYSRGNECRVVSITVKADEACVGAHTDEGVFLPSVNPKYLSRKNLESIEPEPDDSWEKLEEDATQQSCEYFGMDRTPASCDDCPHGWEQTGRACWRNARLDILARAKKLAGIEDLEGGER